jgi:hypothetical protein
MKNKLLRNYSEEPTKIDFPSLYPRILHEKDLEIYDIWEASNGNLFIKLSNNYSIAIGGKGMTDSDIENGLSLKTTSWVKSNDISPVKKIGKIVFD